MGFLFMKGTQIKRQCDHERTVNNTHTTVTRRTAIRSRVDLINVCISINGREILRNVTFSSDCTRIGIIGRNGSGKSTLARTLAGLISPKSGYVWINGKNLAKNRRVALEEIGILFQNPDHQIIFPTVIEEIAFGITQQGRSKTEAADLAKSILKKFQVPHWEDVYINNLSQGQKHLVCLMAVVAMNPRILVLDEPFAGFDIPTKAQLKRYLDYYEGTLLLITHHPGDLKGFQDTMWLDCGGVRDSGPIERILPAYMTEMTRLGNENDIPHLTS